MWYWQDKTIAEIPTRSKAILEIACGTGVGTEKVAKKFPNAQIFAIDLSPGMIRQARKRLKPYKNVHAQVADVEHLPFSKKFYFVFCTEAFQHFPHPAKAVSEISRVTKHKGMVAITDINVVPLSLSNFLFQLEPGFVHMYSRKEFQSLFTRARMKVEKQKRIGMFALMTLGRRKQAVETSFTSIVLKRFSDFFCDETSIFHAT